MHANLIAATERESESLLLILMFFPPSKSQLSTYELSLHLSSDSNLLYLSPDYSIIQLKRSDIPFILSLILDIPSCLGKFFNYVN